MASMLHMDAMVERLREAGIPAAMSDNAGNNLCNQILYEGLQHAEKHAGQPRCGFVHIPALPQQIIERWPDYPFMPLAMLREAMSIILVELVRGALMLRHRTWKIKNSCSSWPAAGIPFRLPIADRWKTNGQLSRNCQQRQHPARNWPSGILQTGHLDGSFTQKLPYHQRVQLGLCRHLLSAGCISNVAYCRPSASQRRYLTISLLMITLSFPTTSSASFE